MIASSKILLDQLLDVLEKISPADYAKSLEILHGASIGAHVRHTLEFYECLLQQSEKGVINYDLRERNHSLETVPSAAIECIKSIKRNLPSKDSNHALTLQFSYDPEGKKQQTIATNYYRELSYVIEHTVHHMALLKIGLHALPEPIKVPSSFGVAISTLRYRNSLPQE